jgi:hypothetical protein
MKRPTLAVSVALLTTIFWRCPVGLAHPLLVHGTGHTGQVVGAFTPPPAMEAASLGGVAAISARDVWAVGASAHSPGTGGSPRGPSGQVLIEHWDGTRWRVVPTPGIPVRPIPALRALTTSGSLAGVAALSSHDVWAVGTTGNALLGVSGDTLVVHWDGRRWRVVPSPRVRGQLTGVAAVAARDVWAAGSREPNPGESGTQPLMEHWDGTRWQLVPLPRSPGQLMSVAAASARDVWTVGGTFGPAAAGATPLTAHWDGTRWHSVPTAALAGFGFLYAVAAISAQDVWVTGGAEAGGPLVEHWDGTRWHRVPTPARAGRDAQLGGIGALSAHDVWAVGSVGQMPKQRMLVEHWDGVRWRVVPTPKATGSFLTGVAAVSAQDVWTVGHVGQPPNYRRLVEHWDGVRWRVVPS